MSLRLCLAVLVAGLVACDDAKSEEEAIGESPSENDGPPPLSPNVPQLPDRPDESAWTAVPSAIEACYLGPDRDGSVCLPTVEWSADWGSAYDYPPPYAGDPQYDAPVRFVDLSDADPSTALAPNFVLSEVMTEAKGRFGLFQAHTIEVLQDIRDSIGGPLRVNSAYRNVDYNAGVGGATYSRHQYGDGMDIASDAASLDELADHCEDLGAGYVDVYASHVHCDWRDTTLDTAFYGAAAARSVAVSDDGTQLMGDLDGEEGPLRVRWLLLDADGQRLDRGTGVALPALDHATSVAVQVGADPSYSLIPLATR